MPTSPAETPPDPRRPGLTRTRVRAGNVARVAIAMVRVVRHAVRGLLLGILALIIVFEEWGWRPLAAAMASLARFQVIARLEAMVKGLPPYGALAVFAVPSLLILPLKLVALGLIAGGHFMTATGLFVFAKIAGTALVAYIFSLTQPALMQLSWFRWTYDTVMPWKHALTEAVRTSWAWRYGRLVKARAVSAVRRRFHRLRPLLDAALVRARELGRALLARVRQLTGA